MTVVRVAVIADYLEEGWPSMDLVADMLMDRFEGGTAGVAATLVRPRLTRRLSRVSRGPRAFACDRMAARLWDYPRVVRGMAGRFDVYHVVDHSYSHLVHRLPARRTVVTCHDLDTFRSVLEPEAEDRSPLFRAMTRRILAGLRKAGHVACDTTATREQAIGLAGVGRDRQVLAAIYRRAALVLVPSEREGFGLPVLESLACGTPVLASAVAALREVGGDAVTYRAVGDIDAWAREATCLLDERACAPDAWRRRSATGLARAAEFSWSRYAGAVARIYRQLAENAGTPC